MGRHRSDPGGGGRYLIVIAGVAVLLALFAVGGIALYGALTTDAGRRDGTTATPDAAPWGTGPAPKLFIEITGAQCYVFVRVPSGDVLMNEVQKRGEKVVFNEPSMQVKLGDAGSATVWVDGEQRRGAASGEETFTVGG